MVHDYHLVTSNSDWENLKHPEAAADGQLPVACRAALTTHEGVPSGVTLYPASLGATMTRLHQVTSVNYISVVMQVQTQTAQGPNWDARAHEP